MLSVVLYCLAVLTLLFLYYFYNPAIEQRNNLNRDEADGNSEVDADIDDTLSETVSTNVHKSKQTPTARRLVAQPSITSMISRDSGVNTDRRDDAEYFHDLKCLLRKYWRAYSALMSKYLGLNYTQLPQTTPVVSQINDNFKTFDELLNELNRLEILYSDLSTDSLLTVANRSGSLNIVLGLDFTASNEWKGRKTFNSQSLHKTLGNKVYNPYQKVISVLSMALNKLLGTSQTASMKIYAYGFGDSVTTDTSVFGLFDPNLQTVNESASIRSFSEFNYVDTFEQVLNRYTEIAKKINLSGPTSFAPIIHKSIEIMKNQQLMSHAFACRSSSVGGVTVKSESVVSKMAYHMLFIITDGKVSDEDKAATISAIIDASHYPLSIVVIGVGDGPWNTMIKYDDRLCSASRFDNFQFVDYHQTVKNSSRPDAELALKAFMEIPEQYRIMKQLNYL